MFGVFSEHDGLCMWVSCSYTELIMAIARPKEEWVCHIGSVCPDWSPGGGRRDDNSQTRFGGRGICGGQKWIGWVGWREVEIVNDTDDAYNESAGGVIRAVRLIIRLDWTRIYSQPTNREDHRNGYFPSKRGVQFPNDRDWQHQNVKISYHV